MALEEAWETELAVADQSALSLALNSAPGQAHALGRGLSDCIAHLEMDSEEAPRLEPTGEEGLGYHSSFGRLKYKGG